MSKFKKWIGAGLGFAFMGPLGAILGFALGKIYEDFSNKDFMSSIKRDDHKTKEGDFIVSLLVLTAAVIKADGKVSDKELSFVKNNFIRMYGAEKAAYTFKLFKNIKSQKISIIEVCNQIKNNMSYTDRTLLIRFLFDTAKSDGYVTEKEINMIDRISNYMDINTNDFNSIKASFYNDIDIYYKILEVDRNSSNEQIKKNYRKLAMKYHPDKFQHLGKEHCKSAREYFNKIQLAYESLKAERGFK